MSERCAPKKKFCPVSWHKNCDSLANLHIYTNTRVAALDVTTRVLARRKRASQSKDIRAAHLFLIFAVRPAATKEKKVLASLRWRKNDGFSAIIHAVVYLLLYVYFCSDARARRKVSRDISRGRRVRAPLPWCQSSAVYSLYTPGELGLLSRARSETDACHISKRILFTYTAVTLIGLYAWWYICTVHACEFGSSLYYTGVLFL